MPVLEHDNAIKQYYEEVKDKYPHIPYERFRLICRSPWIYVKKCIMSTTYAYNIRIKFLGTINLYKGRIKQYKEICQRSFRRGTITKEEYDNRQNYLDRLENYINNDKETKEACRVGKDVEIVD